MKLRDIDISSYKCFKLNSDDISSYKCFKLNSYMEVHWIFISILMGIDN